MASQDTTHFSATTWQAMNLYSLRCNYMAGHESQFIAHMLPYGRRGEVKRVKRVTEALEQLHAGRIIEFLWSVWYK